jgi:hypothetical protein
MSHARTTVCRAPAGERRSLACSRLVCLFVCLLHGAPIRTWAGRTAALGRPSSGRARPHTARCARRAASAVARRVARRIGPRHVGHGADVVAAGPAAGAAHVPHVRVGRRARVVPARMDTLGGAEEPGRTNRTKWEGGVQQVRNRRSEMRRALGGAGRGGAYEDGPMIPWTGVYSLHRPVLTNTDRASGGRIVAYTLRWSYLHGPRSCGRPVSLPRPSAAPSHVAC